MSWREFDVLAKKAVDNGEDAEAINLWRRAVVEAEEMGAEPSVELSTLYHRLGKFLTNSKDQDEKVSLLLKAEKMLLELDPNRLDLTLLLQDLANVLERVGRIEEASARLKMAEAIPEEPYEEKQLPECLRGRRKKDLNIKSTIKALQAHGLARELDAKEFKKLRQVLIEAGRADDNDDSSIHPFDLLFQYYYYGSDHRSETDSCRAWEDDSEFDDVGAPLEATAQMLNELIGEPLVVSDDIKIVMVEPWHMTSGDKIYCVAVDSSRTQGLPSSQGTGLIHVYNWKLAQRKDPKRLLRFAGYDDREIVMLLPVTTAAKLYLAGAGHIFEDPEADLEPDLDAANLVPLKDGYRHTFVKKLF